MSYDISFKVKVEGVDAYVEVGDCDASIAWEARKIIELSTDLPWQNEANNGLCIDVIPKIQQGYNELVRKPNKYKQYESPTGWGTVEKVRNFFKAVLDDWKLFVNWYPELVPVVTFWIE